MSKAIDEMAEVEEDTQKDKYLTFNLGSEAYGIEIKYVTEIIGIQAITNVPELPGYVKGIINLRGNIIPVMDVRVRFKKESKEYDERTCIIVVDINDVSVGLIADAVSEVMNIREENIAPPPSISKSHHNQYVKGIGKANEEVKLLLDCTKLLSSDELEELGDVV